MSPINWPSAASNNSEPRPDRGSLPDLARLTGIGDLANESSAVQFMPEAPRRHLTDLILTAETDRQLRVALAKIRYHDTLYETWGLSAIDPEGRGTILNLYGPPGTGKTFAAEAIADSLGKPIIRIDYAQIESRFVGDTPKNLVAAFAAAKAADTVLFFDEADSVLSRRVTNITQAADYGVNVTRSTLLLQLDSFDGVVIFATNLATNYDSAFVRRITAHVHFPLPDQAALVRLWHYHLPDRLPRLPDVTPDRLAALSSGLSGGDVLNAVILAASSALERGSAAVALTDFEAAIAQIRRAKAEVGQG